MGNTPGADHGWECAGCQAVSGLAYGSPDEARRALTIHLESDHQAEV